MNTRFVAVWGLLAGALGAGGCASPSSELRLDQAANGKTFEVPVAGRIVVTLPSNVTTGYRWELGELNTSVLEKTAQAYESGESQGVGAGGTERWEFVARGAGTTALQLEYRRPWEPKTVAAAQTFQVTVTVTAGSP